MSRAESEHGWQLRLTAPDDPTPLPARVLNVKTRTRGTLLSTRFRQDRQGPVLMVTVHWDDRADAIEETVAEINQACVLQEAP
jgi:hypothetical protein